MDGNKLQCLVTYLSRCDLTGRERQFVARIKEYFISKGHLTEEQEAILEGLYKEKLTWAKSGLITGTRAASGSSGNNPKPAS
jgi:hypothetical protein